MTARLQSVRADLHNHAAGARDFNRLIDTVANRLGDGGIIGLLDFFEHRHFSRIAQLPGYERVWLDDRHTAFYVPERRLAVVGGQELATRDGEFLAVGLPGEARLERGRSLDEALKWAKDCGAITLAPHPFYVDGIGPTLQARPELLDFVDAIEVFNASADFWLPLPPFLHCRHANAKALNFYHAIAASRANPPGVCASSDSHYLSALGTSATRIAPPDPGNFIGSLAASLRQSTPADLIRKPGIRHALRHVMAIFIPVLKDRLTARRS